MSTPSIPATRTKSTGPSVVRGLVESIKQMTRLDRELEVYAHLRNMVPTHEWVNRRARDLRSLAPTVDAFREAHPKLTELNQALKRGVAHTRNSLDVFHNMADRRAAFGHGMGQAFDTVLAKLEEAFHVTTPETTKSK